MATNIYENKLEEMEWGLYLFKISRFANSKIRRGMVTNAHSSKSLHLVLTISPLIIMKSTLVTSAQEYSIEKYCISE